MSEEARRVYLAFKAFQNGSNHHFTKPEDQANLAEDLALLRKVYDEAGRWSEGEYAAWTGLMDRVFGRWIPVGECLPERIMPERDSSDSVWVITDQGRQEYGWYDYVFDQWKTDGPFSEKIYDVTHWRLLPEPPTKDGPP
jgi:hypothetical protein